MLLRQSKQDSNVNNGSPEMKPFESADTGNIRFTPINRYINTYNQLCE